MTFNESATKICAGETDNSTSHPVSNFLRILNAKNY